MRKIRYLLIIGFLVLILISGCSTIEKQSVTTQQQTTTQLITTTDVDPFIQQAQEKASQLSNYKMRLKMSFVSTYRNVIKLDESVRYDDDRIKIDRNLTMINLGKKIIETSEKFIQFQDDKVIQYSQVKDLKWAKSEIKLNDYLSNHYLNYADILAHYKDCSFIGNTTFLLNNVAVYDMTFSMNVLIKELFSEGLLFSGLGINYDDIDQINKDLTVKVYIDKTTYNVLKMEFDFMDYISDILPSGVTDTTKLTYSVEFNEFNQVEVTIPGMMPNKIDLKEVHNNIFQLNFNIDDAAVYTNHPILFIIDKDKNRLYSVNYETKDIKSVELDHDPVALYYREGSIYLAFKIKTSENTETGKIAILHPDTLAMEKEFNVDIKPYDLVVDKKGFIYITEDNYQTDRHAVLDGYDQFGFRLSRNLIYSDSYAVINDINNKIYDTYDTYYRIQSYKFSDGIINGQVRSRYEKRDLGTLKVSPDGQYLFIGNGNILLSTKDTEMYSDLIYLNTLPLPFTDIEFGTNRQNEIYAADKTKIIAYSYGDYKIKGLYLVQGKINHLYYNLDQLVVLGDHYLEVIEPKF